MKKIILSAIPVLLLSVITYGQYTSASAKDPVEQKVVPGKESSFKFSDPDTVTQSDYDKYMQKSRNQKTLGYCFLGVGAVVLIVGLTSFPKNGDLLFTSEEDQKKSDNATTVTAIGAGLMCGSIPFTVLSGVNKRKAKLALKKEATAFGIPINKGKSVTGIAFSIAL